MDQDVFNQALELVLKKIDENWDRDITKYIYALNTLGWGISIDSQQKQGKWEFSIKLSYIEPNISIYIYSKSTFFWEAFMKLIKQLQDRISKNGNLVTNK